MKLFVFCQQAIILLMSFVYQRMVVEISIEQTVNECSVGRARHTRQNVYEVYVPHWSKVRRVS